MSKKYINRKEVKRMISDHLTKGLTKAEILELLEREYYEKDTLRKLVAGTPNPEMKRKYRAYNFILVIATVLIVGYRFLIFGIDYAGSGLTILTLVLGLSILTFEGIAYRLLAMVALITFVKYLIQYGLEPILLVDFILTSGIVAMGFWLGETLFPNYGIIGPKKDDNNQPILE